MADCSKRYNPLDPQHAEEIQKLLFDEGNTEIEEEDFGDEEDTDSDDEVEIRQEESETEEEDSEGDEEVCEGSDSYFVGRDKETKWNKVPSSQRVRFRSHNIIRKLPGTIRAAKAARTPLECWSCLIDDDMLNLVVQYTNQYIESISDRFQRDRDTKPIDIIELKAFIGLLFLAGVNKSNRQSLEDLWGSDGDGTEKFRFVMNIKHFKFILLRFDNRETREERRKLDKITAIREIFAMFVQDCQKSYSVGQNVTVDEKLEGFRGRCSFRQYIPSKPNKYGIKIYALVDSQVFYIYNLEIYTGLQPEGIFRVSNKPLDVVLRLCEPIYQSGRNVTTDNWFTSFQLIEELRRKNLSFVGTVRKNKREIPPEFTTSKGRAVNSSLFGFKKGCTLVSYVPAQGKCVVLASSLHEDDSIDADTGNKQKPSIATFYNGTKGGVDTADKLSATYNVARNVRRWPMVVFFAMINMSGINAQVIFFSNNNNNNERSIRRRMFLKQLSHALVLPHLACRSLNTSGIHMDLQERLKRYRQPQEEAVETRDNGNGSGVKRKRCHTCTGKKRLTKYSCKNCHKPICLMHIESFCSDCSKIPQLLSHNDDVE